MSLKKVIEVWRNEPIEDLLRRLYIDEDMTMPEVAKELYVSQGVIHKWLHEYKINKQNDMWKT